MPLGEHPLGEQLLFQRRLTSRVLRLGYPPHRSVIPLIVLGNNCAGNVVCPDPGRHGHLRHYVGIDVDRCRDIVGLSIKTQGLTTYTGGKSGISKGLKRQRIEISRQAIRTLHRKPFSATINISSECYLTNLKDNLAPRVLDARANRIILSKRQDPRPRYRVWPFLASLLATLAARWPNVRQDQSPTRPLAFRMQAAQPVYWQWLSEIRRRRFPATVLGKSCSHHRLSYQYL